MVGPIDDGLTSAIHGVRWRGVGRRAGNARPTSDPDPSSPGSRLANEPRYMSFVQCGPCPAIARRQATMENVVRTPARWNDAAAGNRGTTIRLSHLPHAARHARCLDRSPPRPSSDDGSIPAASALGSRRQADPSSCISSPSKGSSRRTPPSTSIQHRWAASSSNGREARRVEVEMMRRAASTPLSAGQTERWSRRHGRRRFTAMMVLPDIASIIV